MAWVATRPKEEQESNMHQHQYYLKALKSLDRTANETSLPFTELQWEMIKKLIEDAAGDQSGADDKKIPTTRGDLHEMMAEQWGNLSDDISESRHENGLADIRQMYLLLLGYIENNNQP